MDANKLGYLADLFSDMADAGDERPELLRVAQGDRGEQAVLAAYAAHKAYADECMADAGL